VHTIVSLVKLAEQIILPVFLYHDPYRRYPAVLFVLDKYCVFVVASIRQVRTLLAHLHYNNFAANTAAALIGFALIYLWMVITAH